MTKIIFLEPAEREMVEAAIYYEECAANLGRGFLDEVRDSVDDLSANPLLGRTIRGEVRRRLLRRFPYAILYRIDPGEIIILAVMHLRRKPDYWIKLLP